jgi:hypothetical protein
MPNPVLTGPVNFHQLVVRHVFDEHDKHQVLLELVFVSRYGVCCLEELDDLHGSEKVKAILSCRRYGPPEVKRNRRRWRQGLNAFGGDCKSLGYLLTKDHFQLEKRLQLGRHDPPDDPTGG